ncbi:MAG TPA: DUF2911 domain-containing protein [Chitinophagaceae bacterium]|nr:DUF2911 domain-containing protein [Chitinophagaceae bacterium]
MKKILLFAVVFSSLCGFAQSGKKSPHDTVTYANGKVTYGRPYKNNREIFGGLEKFGKVWRLGADEATTISFNSDTKFGGAGIPAGTYTMFAIPEENEWTIILNSQPGQWGAFGYERNKDKNVAEVKVPVNKLDNVVEQLTIRFDDRNMYIEWDKTRVVVPISY